MDLQDKHYNMVSTLAAKYAKNPQHFDELQSAGYVALVLIRNKHKEIQIEEDHFSAKVFIWIRCYVLREIRKINRSVSMLLNSSSDNETDFLSLVQDRKAEDPVQTTERKEIVVRVFKRLSVRSRRIVQLRLDGYSFKVIAKQMNLNEEYTRRTYHQSIARMKRSYDRWGTNKKARALKIWEENNKRIAERVKEKGRRKGRNTFRLNRLKDRRIVGWSFLTALQGKILSYLCEVETASTEQILTVIDGTISTLRNALSKLKSMKYVERAGGGGLAGSAFYRITQKAKQQRRVYRKG